MSGRDRNICWHTLQAITLPDPSKLTALVPAREKPSWYISSLKGYDRLQIVWMAIESDVPTIVAEFAGSRSGAMRFVQSHRYLPMEARTVKPGLAGFLPLAVEETRESTGGIQVLYSHWKAQTVQNAITHGMELPLGAVQLDRHQETVARMKPPLIIESRSGTGKTLVLIQHSAYHAGGHRRKPACFVTVSPRLKTVLERNYKRMNTFEHGVLPETLFYCHDDLLERLAEYKRIMDFDGMSRCTFVGFQESRRSHERMHVDMNLVESEIGGVILGSVVAAEQGKALSRQQYLEEKRSNIGCGFEYTSQLRSQVYDYYEQYSSWKRQSSMYDIGDVVLRLLREDWDELFSMGKCIATFAAWVYHFEFIGQQFRVH